MENVSLMDEEIDLEVSKNIETIDDLNNEIQNATPNSNIKLENDIVVNQDAKCQGIEIFNNISIDGQGHKIDGNSSDMSFLFRIHHDDVVLKNIVFTNWDLYYSYNLIEWMGNNGQMRNCTFINNSAVYGGSVDWTGINGFLINCTFTNNVAENGGAIYWYGPYGSIANCIFVSNSAEIGGAAYITGRDTKLDASKFRNNSADDIGGGVYSDGLNFVLSNCGFVNNTAINGGAVYTTSFPSLVDSSNFTNNNAEDTAGAIYFSSDDNTVKNSIFTNNSANSGGAIYSDVNNDLVVINSQFNNNSAQEHGGAIMIDECANITNSTFKNNRAGIGGAVYSDTETIFINSEFSNNKAENGGAIAMYDGDIIGSTFTQNVANESGGAISVAGDLNVNKTTFSKNTAADASNNIFSDDAEVTVTNVTSDTPLISKNLDISVEISNITVGETLIIKVVMPENITKGQIIAKVNGKTYTVKVTYLKDTIKTTVKIK